MNQLKESNLNLKQNEDSSNGDKNLKVKRSLDELNQCKHFLTNKFV